MSYLRNNPQAMQALQQGMSQGGAGGFGVPGMNQVELPPGGGGGLTSMPMPGVAGQPPSQQLGNKPMPLGGDQQDPRFANKPMPGPGGGLSMPQVPYMPQAPAGPGIGPQVQPMGPMGGEKPMPTDPRFDPSVTANKPMPPGTPSASQRVRDNAQANITRQQGMQQDPAYQRQQNALAQAAGKPLPFGQGNPGAAEILAKPMPGIVTPVEGPLAGKPPASETPGNPTDPVYTKPKPGRRVPMTK